jgi:hypothetical protein
MNDTPEMLAALRAEYRRLRQSLARIGHISQGSVQQRSVAASGRSGYQWTRKVAQKTVSVALSQAQFEALKEAVANERKLWTSDGARFTPHHLRLRRRYTTTQAPLQESFGPYLTAIRVGSWF